MTAASIGSANRTLSCDETDAHEIPAGEGAAWVEIESRNGRARAIVAAQLAPLPAETAWIRVGPDLDGTRPPVSLTCLTNEGASLAVGEVFLETNGD